jgi:integrase/recombinase XerD
MTPLREKFIRDLKLRNYRKTTQDIYVKAVIRFAKYFKRSPDSLGIEELKQYFAYLLEEREVSFSYYKQVLGALRFLYSQTLGRRWMLGSLKYPRQAQKLPIVPSRNEVLQLIQTIPDLRIKTAVMLIYASGLRLMEACLLKVEDIDSQRMIIRVRDGKGGKQREVFLSACLLKHLREYWFKYHPQNYLFASPGGPPLNENTVQDWCREASRRARINPPISPRTLRHAYATHLLEAGTDIRVIQELLGHTNINTTLVYTHVNSSNYKQIKDPLAALLQ